MGCAEDLRISIGQESQERLGCSPIALLILATILFTDKVGKSYEINRKIFQIGKVMDTLALEGLRVKLEGGSPDEQDQQRIAALSSIRIGLGNGLDS